MKAIHLSMVMMIAGFLFSCNNEGNSTENKNVEKEGTTVSTRQTSNETATTTNADNSNNPINNILSTYLDIKNALAADNSQDAANAGKAMHEALQNVDKSAMDAKQKAAFEEVEEDVNEHAEHINENKNNIKHQREHFDLLSQDMYDLVKAFGAGRTLYQANCSMYNNNKGASWLSESKDIKNPYYGDEMLTCGTIEEEIK